MKLYDIYYNDNTFDQCTKLPKVPTKGTVYAVCVNFDGTKLVAKDGKWVHEK